MRGWDVRPVCVALACVVGCTSAGEPARDEGAGGSTGGGASGTAGISAGGNSAAGASNALVAPAYAPDFALNQKIPEAAPSDPRSAAVVGRLDANSAIHKVNLANHGEVPTLYEVTPTDAEYTVDATYLDTTTFRVPAKAVAGEGSDYPLLVLDPAHPVYGPFTELRVWQAVIDHTQKLVSGSGAGLFHYNNDGAILNPDGTKSHSIPFQGAGTGSGLSYLAGLVRPAEVKSGEISHAIRFAYSNCDSSDQFRAPAVETDQPKNCTTAQAAPEERMDMGMRLQLDPTLDCESRTVPGKASSSSETRFLHIFCRALQDYGMVMLDGTGPGGLVFYLENEATAGWQAVIGEELYGSFSYLVRDQDTPSDGLARGPSDGIPWHRMRVLASSAW